ncbi:MULTISPECIES: hypothetical protein [Streptomyces]|uniref:hypothetical protein n=1 Tax=Streptomyces TaxID=1883 RepID=UPI0006DC3630|nr:MULTISPECIES: hypothetical protein [Streptomyces]
MGIDLEAMQGFGGGRSWSEFASPLRPFLDHPHDRGQLSVVECTQVLPRLKEIVANWSDVEFGDLDEDLLDDAKALVTVLEVCVQQSVPMLFS